MAKELTVVAQLRKLMEEGAIPPGIAEPAIRSFLSMYPFSGTADLRKRIALLGSKEKKALVEKIAEQEHSAKRRAVRSPETEQVIRETISKLNDISRIGSKSRITQGNFDYLSGELQRVADVRSTYNLQGPEATLHQRLHSFLQKSVSTVGEESASVFEHTYAPPQYDMSPASLGKFSQEQQRIRDKEETLLEKVRGIPESRRRGIQAKFSRASSKSISAFRYQLRQQARRLGGEFYVDPKTGNVVQNTPQQRQQFVAQTTALLGSEEFQGLDPRTQQMVESEINPYVNQVGRREFRQQQKALSEKVGRDYGIATQMRQIGAGYMGGKLLSPQEQLSAAQGLRGNIQTRLADSSVSAPEKKALESHYFRVEGLLEKIDKSILVEQRETRNQYSRAVEKAEKQRPIAAWAAKRNLLIPSKLREEEGTETREGFAGRLGYAGAVGKALTSVVSDISKIIGQYLKETVAAARNLPAQVSELQALPQRRFMAAAGGTPDEYLRVAGQTLFPGAPMNFIGSANARLRAEEASKQYLDTVKRQEAASGISTMVMGGAGALGIVGGIATGGILPLAVGAAALAGAGTGVLGNRWLKSFLPGMLGKEAETSYQLEQYMYADKIQQQEINANLMKSRALGGLMEYQDVVRDTMLKTGGKAIDVYTRGYPGSLPDSTPNAEQNWMQFLDNVPKSIRLGVKNIRGTYEGPRDEYDADIKERIRKNLQQVPPSGLGTSRFAQGLGIVPYMDELKRQTYLQAASDTQKSVESRDTFMSRSRMAERAEINSLYAPLRMKSDLAAVSGRAASYEENPLWWMNYGISPEELTRNVGGLTRLMPSGMYKYEDIDPATGRYGAGFSGKMTDSYRRMFEMGFLGVGDVGQLQSNFASLVGATGGQGFLRDDTGAITGRTDSATGTTEALRGILTQAIRAGFDSSLTGQKFVQTTIALSQYTRDSSGMARMLGTVSSVLGGRMPDIEVAARGMTDLKSGWFQNPAFAGLMSTGFFTEGVFNQPDSPLLSSIISDPFKAQAGVSAIGDLLGRLKNESPDNYNAVATQFLQTANLPPEVSQSILNTLGRGADLTSLLDLQKTYSMPGRYTKAILGTDEEFSKTREQIKGVLSKGGGKRTEAEFMSIRGLLGDYINRAMMFKGVDYGQAVVMASSALGLTGEGGGMTPLLTSEDVKAMAGQKGVEENSWARRGRVSMMTAMIDTLTGGSDGLNRPLRDALTTQYLSNQQMGVFGEGEAGKLEGARSLLSDSLLSRYYVPSKKQLNIPGGGTFKIDQSNEADLRAVLRAVGVDGLNAKGERDDVKMLRTFLEKNTVIAESVKQLTQSMMEQPYGQPVYVTNAEQIGASAAAFARAFSLTPETKSKVELTQPKRD